MNQPNNPPSLSLLREALFSLAADLEGRDEDEVVSAILSVRVFHVNSSQLLDAGIDCYRQAAFLINPCAASDDRLVLAVCEHIDRHVYAARIEINDPLRVYLSGRTFESTRDYVELFATLLDQGTFVHGEHLTDEKAKYLDCHGQSRFWSALLPSPFISASYFICSIRSEALDSFLWCTRISPKWLSKSDEDNHFNNAERTAARYFRAITRLMCKAVIRFIRELRYHDQLAVKSPWISFSAYNWIVDSCSQEERDRRIQALNTYPAFTKELISDWHLTQAVIQARPLTKALATRFRVSEAKIKAMAKAAAALRPEYVEEDLSVALTLLQGTLPMPATRKDQEIYRTIRKELFPEDVPIEGEWLCNSNAVFGTGAWLQGFGTNSWSSVRDQIQRAAGDDELSCAFYSRHHAFDAAYQCLSWNWYAHGCQSTDEAKTNLKRFAIHDFLREIFSKKHPTAAFRFANDIHRATFQPCDPWEIVWEPLLAEEVPVTFGDVSVEEARDILDLVDFGAKLENCLGTLGHRCEKERTRYFLIKDSDKKYIAAFELNWTMFEGKAHFRIGQIKGPKNGAASPIACASASMLIELLQTNQLKNFAEIIQVKVARGNPLAKTSLLNDDKFASIKDLIQQCLSPYVPRSLRSRLGSQSG